MSVGAPAEVLSGCLAYLVFIIVHKLVRRDHVQHLDDAALVVLGCSLRREATDSGDANIEVATWVEPELAFITFSFLPPTSMPLRVLRAGSFAVAGSRYSTNAIPCLGQFTSSRT